MEGDILDAAIATFRYQHSEEPQLKQIEFHLESARIHVLLGPSGAGKSTLLNALLPGPEGAMNGTVTYNSSVFGGLSPSVACGMGLVGVLGQRPSLLPWLKIRENILAPRRLNPRAFREDPAQRIAEVMESIALNSSVLDQYPYQLSFGMKQRVALARAILFRPAFLLLDEVFTGLDPATTDLISEVIKSYTINNNSVTFIITHSIECALEVSRSLFFMKYGGRIDRISSTASMYDIKSMYIEELKRPAR